MKLINVILIDPFACEVREIQIEAGNLQSYYDALSHESMAVDIFTTAKPGILKGLDALFVDDEGLLKNAQRWFVMPTAHQSFAGKGLIVGADSSGDSTDAATDVRLIRAITVFAEPSGDALRVVQAPWTPPRNT
jgi:hypothetical protein